MMKANKKVALGLLFVSIGILMIVTPLLLRHFFPLSDIFRGVLTGVGIGLEIAGLVSILKVKTAERAN